MYIQEVVKSLNESWILFATYEELSGDDLWSSTLASTKNYQFVPRATQAVCSPLEDFFCEPGGLHKKQRQQRDKRRHKIIISAIERKVYYAVR